MTPAEALCILGSLADGIDPVTGDMLPETSETRAPADRAGLALRALPEKRSREASRDNQPKRMSLF